MAHSKELAAYLATLQGAAFDYAGDYADFWQDGGRRPQAGDYGIGSGRSSELRRDVEALCEGRPLPTPAAATEDFTFTLRVSADITKTSRSAHSTASAVATLVMNALNNDPALAKVLANTGDRSTPNMSIEIA